MDLSHFQSRYGDFTGQLPDIIAVKSGLKPVARFRASGREGFQDFPEFKRICEEEGLAASRTEEDGNYQTNVEVGYYIYISRSGDLVEKAKKTDPSIGTGDPRKFGSVLGYPECCVERLRPENVESVFLSEPVQTFDYRLNFFINFTNYYLVSHVPCSGACRRSLEYSKSLFEKVKEFDSDYAARMRENLKLPVLVYFPDDTPANSLDRRETVVFDGEFEGDSLHYTGFETDSSPDSGNDIKENLPTLKKGDVLELGEGSIIIQKDEERLGSLPADSYTLFRFDDFTEEGGEDI